MTTRGQGEDAPVWSHTGLSSGSDSQTEANSGVGSYQKPQNNAGSTAQLDNTALCNPNTVRQIDEGDLEDAPLSDHSGNSDDNQEMASADDGAQEVTGANPVQPPRQGPAIMSPGINIAVTLEAPLLADPDNTDDEKGFHAATRTLSDGYQEACKEVQTIVRKSLRRSTTIDRTFVWGASAAIHHWVRAVHSAMDCLGESIEVQSHLLQEA